MECPLCKQTLKIGYEVDCENVNWLWFGCGKCGIYMEADNIGGLLYKFNKLAVVKYLFEL